MKLTQNSDQVFQISHDLKNCLLYLKLLQNDIQSGEIPDSDEWPHVAEAISKIDTFFASVQKTSQNQDKFPGEVSDLVNQCDDFFYQHSNRLEMAALKLQPVINEFLSKTAESLSILEVFENEKLLPLLLKDVPARTHLISLPPFDFILMGNFFSKELVDWNINFASTEPSDPPEMREKKASHIGHRASLFDEAVRDGTLGECRKNLCSSPLDLAQRIRKLHGEMSSNSVMILAAPHPEDCLFQIERDYSFISKEWQIRHSSDVIEQTLTQLGILFEKYVLNSELLFEDSRANRVKILLSLGSHRDHQDSRLLDTLDRFDKFEAGNKISIPLTDCYFVVRKLTS